MCLGDIARLRRYCKVCESPTTLGQLAPLQAEAEHQRAEEELARQKANLAEKKARPKPEAVSWRSRLIASSSVWKFTFSC